MDTVDFFVIVVALIACPIILWDCWKDYQKINQNTKD